jgi:hypothetical protein
MSYRKRVPYIVFSVRFYDEYEKANPVLTLTKSQLDDLREKKNSKAMARNNSRYEQKRNYSKVS